MRISRPCYDKMHRCPGWAGGGTRSARVDRCADGRLVGTRNGDLYAGRFWPLRFNRCDTCDVLVLPSAVRWVDPGWWRWRVRWWLRDAADWVAALRDGGTE